MRRLPWEGALRGRGLDRVQGLGVVMARGLVVVVVVVAALMSRYDHL